MVIVLFLVIILFVPQEDVAGSVAVDVSVDFLAATGAASAVLDSLFLILRSVR